MSEWEPVLSDERLDLDQEHIRQAQKGGIVVVIGGPLVSLPGAYLAGQVGEGFNANVFEGDGWPYEEIFTLHHINADTGETRYPTWLLCHCGQFMWRHYHWLAFLPVCPQGCD